MSWLNRLVMELFVFLLPVLAVAQQEADAVQGTPPRAMLLVSDRQAFQVKADVIGSARKYVNFTTYVFEPDNVGLLTLSLLRDAARRLGGTVSNEKVRVILDHHGARHVSPALRKHLINEGVALRIYNQESLAKPLKYQRRMHDKGAMADGERIELGGRNTKNGYYGGGSPQELNLDDIGVYLEGPQVGEADKHFTKYWNSAEVAAPKGLDKVTEKELLAAKELLDRHDARKFQRIYGPTPPKEKLFEALREVDSIEFVSAPVGTPDKSSGVGRRLLKLIGDAKKDLLIVSPYFILPEPMMEAIEQARARNIQVDAITNSRKTADGVMTAAAYRKDIPRLEKLGVNMKELAIPMMLHGKVYSRDGGTETYFGSHNVDPRSFRINTEWGVIIRAQGPFVEDFQEYRRATEQATLPATGPMAARGMGCRDRTLQHVFFELLASPKAVRDLL